MSTTKLPPSFPTGHSSRRTKLVVKRTVSGNGAIFQLNSIRVLFEYYSTEQYNSTISPKKGTTARKRYYSCISKQPYGKFVVPDVDFEYALQFFLPDS